MKEKPILFSGPMVRAILEGSKTMTRTQNYMKTKNRKTCRRQTPCRPLPIPAGGNPPRQWHIYRCGDIQEIGGPQTNDWELVVPIADLDAAKAEIERLRARVSECYSTGKEPIARQALEATK